MSEAMERLRNEGIVLGETRRAEEIVYNLLDWLDDETLSQATFLPIERVREIRESRKKKFIQ